MRLFADEKLAQKTIRAIREGDLPQLQRLLQENEGLATATVISGQGKNGSARSLLHIAADWPGHYPNGAETVRLLAASGADVNARFQGAHRETPLHWAASTNDVPVLDALLDAGADPQADGAVIAGGTPLDDAVAFGQWHAARRLVERGACMALWHAAALGDMEAMERHFAGEPLSRLYPWGAAKNDVKPPDEIQVAFWCACHGGQWQAADWLLGKGADINWISPWDRTAPLDAALRSGARGLAQWLRSQGARLEKEIDWK